MKILMITPQQAIPPTDGGKMEIYHSIKTIGTVANVHVTVPRVWGLQGKADDETLAAYSKLGAQATLLPAVRPESYLKIALNLFQRLPFKIQKYQSRESLKVMESLCAEEGYDIIWVIGLHLMPYAISLNSRFGIPVILREHNIECDLVKQYGRLHSSLIHRWVARWQYPKTVRFERKAWLEADQTLFISDADFSYARALGYVGSDEDVLYPIVPVQDMEPLTASETEPAVLYPLRLNGTVQNIYSAIRFIREVWVPFARKHSHLYLAIIGSTAKDLENIGILMEVQERSRIRPMGFVPDVGECIRKHRYFISPTYFGSGLRIKLVEAMGQGCLCLCSPLDLRSLKIFKDRENLCCFEDARSFEAVLTHLEADSEQSTTIRKAAWRTARDHFREDNYIHKVSEACSLLIAERAPF